MGNRVLVAVAIALTVGIAAGLVISALVYNGLLEACAPGAAPILHRWMTL